MSGINNTNPINAQPNANRAISVDLNNDGKVNSQDLVPVAKLVELLTSDLSDLRARAIDPNSDKEALVQEIARRSDLDGNGLRDDEPLIRAIFGSEGFSLLHRIAQLEQADASFFDRNNEHDPIKQQIYQALKSSAVTGTLSPVLNGDAIRNYATQLDAREREINTHVNFSWGSWNHRRADGEYLLFQDRQVDGLQITTNLVRGSNRDMNFIFGGRSWSIDASNESITIDGLEFDWKGIWPDTNKLKQRFNTIADTLGIPQNERPNIKFQNAWNSGWVFIEGIDPTSGAELKIHANNHYGIGVHELRLPYGTDSGQVHGFILDHSQDISSFDVLNNPALLFSHSPGETEEERVDRINDHIDTIEDNISEAFADASSVDLNEVNSLLSELVVIKNLNLEDTNSNLSAAISQLISESLKLDPSNPTDPSDPVNALVASIKAEFANEFSSINTQKELGEQIADLDRQINDLINQRDSGNLSSILNNTVQSTDNTAINANIASLQREKETTQNILNDLNPEFFANESQENINSLNGLIGLREQKLANLNSIISSAADQATIDAASEEVRNIGLATLALLNGANSSDLNIPQAVSQNANPSAGDLNTIDPANLLTSLNPAFSTLGSDTDTAITTLNQLSNTIADIKTNLQGLDQNSQEARDELVKLNQYEIIERLTQHFLDSTQNIENGLAEQADLFTADNTVLQDKGLDPNQVKADFQNYLGFRNQALTQLIQEYQKTPLDTERALQLRTVLADTYTRINNIIRNAGGEAISFPNLNTIFNHKTSFGGATSASTGSNLSSFLGNDSSSTTTGSSTDSTTSTNTGTTTTGTTGTTADTSSTGTTTTTTSTNNTGTTTTTTTSTGTTSGASRVRTTRIRGTGSGSAGSSGIQSTSDSTTSDSNEGSTRSRRLRGA